ncbi:hypothetical protein KY311_04985 [Candidatus Woesearchaeota archaeon]|nr:hypothetical protein [Candidatus Woesearchaeota archaeon]MBW3017151.1 hypothetical protein [Candidatus Woesearchaeota archaeon]
MMNKKAVSPLIATVLLIAFAVALGAIVMNWGESFVRETQETAEEASEGRLDCTLAVDFEVINARYTEDDTDETANVTILVRNAGDQEIAEFVAQVFTNSVRGGRGNITQTLESLDVATLEIEIDVDWDKFDTGLLDPLDDINITEVRIIPKIDTGAPTGPVACTNKYERILADDLVMVNNP